MVESNKDQICLKYGKSRLCLKCGVMFFSVGVGNRICGKCHKRNCKLFELKTTPRLGRRGGIASE